MEVKTAGDGATRREMQQSRDWRTEKDDQDQRYGRRENPGGERDFGAVTRDREPRAGPRRFRTVGKSE